MTDDHDQGVDERRDEGLRDRIARSGEDALGKLVHEVAGYFGTAKLWLDEQLRRARD